MKRLLILGASLGAMALPATAGAVVIPGAEYTGTFTTGTAGATVAFDTSPDGSEAEDFFAVSFGQVGCPDNSIGPLEDLPISGQSFSFTNPTPPPTVNVSGFFGAPGRASGTARISGVCDSGFQSWTATTPIVWPDGSVGRSTDAALLGDNVYNTTAAGQTRKWKAKRGQRRTFEVGIENDGTEAGAIVAKGCRGSRKFKVKYFDGAQNVTADVIAGEYGSSLDPDGYNELDLRIKPTRRTRPGNKKSCTVSIERLGGETDVVKAELRVRRG